VGFLRRLFGATPELPTPRERQRLDHRAETLPVGYKRLIQGPPLDVHGESHHRAEIEAAVGRRPEGHQDIVDAALVWEPDNPWDPNAIAVQVAGRTCGYIPKLDAKRYRPVMKWARNQGFVAVVRADVTGGWQLPDQSWAEFGIRLYLASPDQILGRPELPPPVPSREHQWVGQVIAFTGDSRCVIAGERLDRARSEELARAAGIEVHERVTKKVQLLVDCDDETVSGNQRKAIEYGIQVVREAEFWAALGLAVETI
jgi:hypothetical protein